MKRENICQETVYAGHRPHKEQMGVSKDYDVCSELAPCTYKFMARPGLLQLIFVYLGPCLVLPAGLLKDNFCLQLNITQLYLILCQYETYKGVHIIKRVRFQLQRNQLQLKSVVQYNTFSSYQILLSSVFNNNVN